MTNVYFGWCYGSWVVLLGGVTCLQEPVIGRESAGCDLLLNLEAFLGVVSNPLHNTCTEEPQ